MIELRVVSLEGLISRVGHRVECRRLEGERPRDLCELLVSLRRSRGSVRSTTFRNAELSHRV